MLVINTTLNWIYSNYVFSMVFFMVYVYIHQILAVIRYVSKARGEIRKSFVIMQKACLSAFVTFI